MAPLFGHAAAVAAFRRGLDARRFHHAWLLAGPRGVGKGTFARAAARRLLSDAAGPPVVADDLSVPDAHPMARLLDAALTEEPFHGVPIDDPLLYQLLEACGVSPEAVLCEAA